MSEHGIEANPKKIMAISNMGPIHNVKGVQSLTGCLAALSRFISRLARAEDATLQAPQKDRCLHLD